MKKESRKKHIAEPASAKKILKELGISLYQNVIITLSDGSVHIFTGKAFSRFGEERRITSIKFTEPKPLPPGYEFEPIPK